MMFFFFKQKTAYEMRISDWSSDVCSSDLLVEADRAAQLLDGDVALDQGRHRGIGGPHAEAEEQHAAQHLPQLLVGEPEQERRYGHQTGAHRQKGGPLYPGRYATEPHVLG